MSITFVPSRSTLPSGDVGHPYNMDIEVIGSIDIKVKGEIPGLKININDNIVNVQGIPSELGTYHLAIIVKERRQTYNEQ